MVNRREFFGITLGAGASLALTPELLRALQPPGGSLIQRAIPSSGEMLPVVGLTFGNNPSCADRAVLEEVLRTWVDNGGRVVDAMNVSTGTDSIRMRGMCEDSVVGLYDRWAEAYDRDRSRSLQEREWLDRFLSLAEPGGTILDLGCGMGEPIARYLLDRGFAVVGVDSSPSMIALCRARFPGAEWHVADMRELDLNRRFDGILAWDSFFHLGMDAQRGMFPRFAAHARHGAPLMFTSGPAEGEAIGSYREEPLYHASLAASEYRRLLESAGFQVRSYQEEDPACGAHTVWLATYGAVAAEPRVGAPRP